MAPQITINRFMLEAFLDEELDSSEMEEIAQHLEQDEASQHLLADVQYHRNLVSSSLHDKIQVQIAGIDWDAVSANTMAQWHLEQCSPQHSSIARQPSLVVSACSDEVAAPPSLRLPPTNEVPTMIPPQNTKPSDSWTFWQWATDLWLWAKHHPGVTMSCVAVMGIVVVFAVPYFDPGPKHDHDVVVQQVANIDTAQVAVLQAKNKSTGKQMTVIVIDEPTLDLTHQVAPAPSRTEQKKGERIP